ncbi:hypothetical protein ACQKWADRAFT_142578 [Trichoderma austrokoningii]
MVIADQYFSFGVGPPTRKPTKLSFLGAGGDICYIGRVEHNWTFSRFPLQAISSRKSSIGDILDLASVVTISDGTSATTRRSHPALTALNHSRHDIPGSTAGQSNPRQFTAPRSSTWAAAPTTPLARPSHPPTRRPESLMKSKKLFHPSNNHADGNHYYNGDKITKIVHRLFVRSQSLLRLTQNHSKVKGIYAGFVMVESKCIQVDKEQASHNEPRCALNNSNMHSLIALQSTLLHEHHDFFLASQHPSANPALRCLASKYAMPARMWRHGIHTFFELLRHSMPYYMEHMLAFIYVTYTMMALLYETVSTPEDTWAKCLGDLGSYRMAIEDDDSEIESPVHTFPDRGIAWQLKTMLFLDEYSGPPSLKIGITERLTAGRLYHHLGILARPNATQQLFYYQKSGLPTSHLLRIRVQQIRLSSSF